MTLSDKERQVLERTVYSTGWFGVPGEISYQKVHVVYRYGHALLCGAKVSDRAEFQFCAAGIHEKYVTCGNCQRSYTKARQEVEGRF